MARKGTTRTTRTAVWCRKPTCWQRWTQSRPQWWCRKWPHWPQSLSCPCWRPARPPSGLRGTAGRAPSRVWRAAPPAIWRTQLCTPGRGHSWSWTPFRWPPAVGPAWRPSHRTGDKPRGIPGYLPCPSPTGWSPSCPVGMRASPAPRLRHRCECPSAVDSPAQVVASAACADLRLLRHYYRCHWLLLAAILGPVCCFHDPSTTTTRRRMSYYCCWW